MTKQNKINTTKNKTKINHNTDDKNSNLYNELNQFFFFILNLKRINRSGWSNKINIKHPESVAEHTYSLCLISMLFSDIFGFKTEKIIKMSLLHDLAETITGDYIPDEISIEEKIIKEDNAIKKILSLLPKRLKTEYMSIWKEYVLNTSDASRVVHNLDKFEMLLQANMYLNNGISYKSLKPFYDSALNYLKTKEVNPHKINTNYIEFRKLLLQLSEKFYI